MDTRPLTIRAAWIAIVATAACGPSSARATDGRITFQAHLPKAPIALGQTSLGLAPERDGFVFVPRDTTDRRGVPLLILLHGATQRAAPWSRNAGTINGVVALSPGFIIPAPQPG